MRRLAALLLAFAASACLAQPVTVREYFNRHNGHFVLIANPEEMRLVDSGIFGPWVRTGYAFQVPAEAGGRPRVCRFHSARSDSHFITADAEECAFLRAHTEGEWRFEHVDFAVDLPGPGGGCAQGLVPIYRMYNDRWRQRDSNHRFSAERLAIEDRVARGWIDEGVRFCALTAWREPEHRLVVETEQVRPTAECEDESVSLGGCVALNQFARMDNLIPPWAPQYSSAFRAATGTDGVVHTAQPALDAAAAARHAFAQTAGTRWPRTFGMHVNGPERTRGELASINPLYQLVTAPPTAGAADRRVFPWPGGRDSDLLVSFHMNVARVVRLEPSAHGYGHPTLQFRDTKSGQDLYVTMGTYGTVEPVDFVAMDESTQRVIVATIFRADPAFGTRIAGEYNPCDGRGACARAGPQPYRFRINRGDFASILGKARALHPQLSADPADYLLVNYHFNNETYRDAAIGATLSDYMVEIFPAY